MTRKHGSLPNPGVSVHDEMGRHKKERKKYNADDGHLLYSRLQSMDRENAPARRCLFTG